MVLDHGGRHGGAAGGRQRHTISIGNSNGEDGGERNRNGQQQHCGLCSLVARAFRRAVCGAPSRRGSGDSYQELTAPDQEAHATDDEHILNDVSLTITMYTAVRVYY